MKQESIWGCGPESGKHFAAIVTALRFRRSFSFISIWTPPAATINARLGCDSAT
jgi:hypothetical protein